jgi:hypothetical protein
MSDLRSPLEDRPYRPATRPVQADRVISTPQYYRSKFDAVRQHRFFPLGSVLVAVFAFAMVISYAYNEGSQTSANATTPLITASNESFKEKPENPGGMDVPFQDAIVFDQFQSGAQSAANNVESLLPTPEQPIATAEQKGDTITIKEKPAEVAQAETKTETLPTPSNETLASTTMDDVARKLDEMAPASAPATTKIDSGNYRIQLGAFRDQTAAKSAWTKYQKEFSSQLSSVTPDFPRADLGAKGVFYRVQGINLSKATADELCRSINAAQKGACLVVK